MSAFRFKNYNAPRPIVFLPRNWILVVRVPLKSLAVSYIVGVSFSALDQQSLVGLHPSSEQSRNDQFWANHEPDLFLHGTLKIPLMKALLDFNRVDMTFRLYQLLTLSKAPPPMCSLAKSSCRAPCGASSREVTESTLTLWKRNPLCSPSSWSALR